MRKRSRNLYILRVFAMSTVALCISAFINGSSKAQTNSQQPEEGSGPARFVDEFDRSFRTNTYKLVADSGAARGETIYYYKCWMCHNKYTKGASHAPYLQDIYKHSSLASGEPVNDESIAAQIKNGSSFMPSFRTSLSDSDVADLLAYLREGKCCEEGEDPPANPWYQAETHKWPVQTAVSGGATGVVRIPGGDPPEGIMVQLIAPSGVRTTVYTDADGHYEFPKMQAGPYTLRIPEPLEFKPYRRDAVQIAGATKLDDIVLGRVTQDEGLPSFPELESQLSGVELLWNLPGTPQEKEAIVKGCGCHTYQQILRNRYDEPSWGLIVNRMLNGAGATLINQRPGKNPDAEMIVKFLARVRGPESKDPPMQTFPRVHGPGTRAVITEYELPRTLLSNHDVAGDSKGNIWFTSHKTRYFGKLDPRTGIVTGYMLPLTEGALPGSHHIVVDKNDNVWISENWAHKLTKFDPRTQEFTQVSMAAVARGPLNNPDFGNFALASDGYIWYSVPGAVDKIDPETGKVADSFPIKSRGNYDNTISADGKYWAGGAPGGESYTMEFVDILARKTIDINTGGHPVRAARGGFDLNDNAWFGTRMGTFAEIDHKTGRMSEYWPPIPYEPYAEFYEAMPDKNGEVWGGMQTGREFLRFNPQTNQWTEYRMPEPFSYNRRTWIDNSTNPVTVWYVDYAGYIARIQPLK